MGVEAFVAKAPIDAFRERVLRGLARLNVLDVDAVPGGPLHEPKARELAAVVAHDATWASARADCGVEHLGDRGGWKRRPRMQRDRLPCEVVDGREDTIPAAVIELVVHEVHAPSLAGAARERCRLADDALEAFSLPASHREPFFAVDASHPTLPDRKALALEEPVHTAVPEAWMGVRRLTQRVAELGRLRAS